MRVRLLAWTRRAPRPRHNSRFQFTGTEAEAAIITEVDAAAEPTATSGLDLGDMLWLQTHSRGSVLCGQSGELLAAVDGAMALTAGVLKRRPWPRKRSALAVPEKSGRLKAEEFDGISVDSSHGENLSVDAARAMTGDR